MGDPTSLPPTRQSGGGSEDEDRVVVGTGASAAASPETVREPPRGTAMTGEIIAGRYKVEKLVGTGGMAHVLSARHVELGHRVAIKVLDPTLNGNADAKERFAREARAMATLTNKHTVRIHDIGTLPNGLPYMVMDLLVGKDLSQVLNDRGPLPFEEACLYIDQACEAVAEAHDLGLVHRDIKPQNLFLTREKSGGGGGGAGDEQTTTSSVRVLDFGIVRAVGGRMGNMMTITKVGDVIGTLSYMAPEQIRDSSNVNSRADIWALGACLYRLICGKPPFVAKGEAMLAEAILVKPPTPVAEYRADCPSILSSVIMRCLRKEPDERFQTARDLRRALEEARVMLAVAPISGGGGAGEMSTEPLQQIPQQPDSRREGRASHPNVMTLRAAGNDPIIRPKSEPNILNATLASAGVSEHLLSQPLRRPASGKHDATVRLSPEPQSGQSSAAGTKRPTPMNATVPLKPITPQQQQQQQRSMTSDPMSPPHHRASQPYGQHSQQSQQQRQRQRHQPSHRQPSRKSGLMFLFIVMFVATIVIGTGLFVIFVLRP